MMPSPLPTCSASAATTVNKTKNGRKYNRTFENPNQKTPYQGSSRSFGYFHCETCNVDWTSANTWANKGQDCFTCLKNTYPYRQMPLLKGNGLVNRNKPHPEAHCEMCKYLKEPCKNKSFINQNNKRIKGKMNKGTVRNRTMKTVAVANEE